MNFKPIKQGLSTLSSTVVLLWVTSTTPLAAQNFEVHGYLRAGTNYSDGLTKGVCYKEQVSAIGNPGRFGNECDNLFEIVTKSYLYGSGEMKTKPWVALNITGQLFYDGDKSEEFVSGDNVGRTWSGNETIFHFPNTYVEMGGMAGDAVMWIGRRWYRRIFFFQTDVFTLNNNGNGFGMYDIGVGPGKLHLALLRRIENQEQTDTEGNTSVVSGPVYNTFDARYSTSFGPLPVDIIYLHQETGTNDAYGQNNIDYDRATGDLFALFSEYYGSFSNRAYIGYGVGLFGQGGTSHIGAGHLNYSGFGLTKTEWSAKRDARSLRFINESGFNLISNLLSLNLSFLYSQIKDVVLESQEGNTTSYINVDGDNYSIGVKPQLFLGKYLSLVLDLAHTTQSRDDYSKTHRLNKGTVGAVIKPQLASAPGAAEFRLYATRANWDTDGNYPGDKGGDDYAEKGSGNTYGVQVDVFW